MIWPRFAGSALNRASCQSPTDSKTKPPSQTTPPTTVTAPTGARSSIPAWIGRQASHKVRAWIR